VLVSAAPNVFDTPIVAEAKLVAVAGTPILFASDVTIVNFVIVAYEKPPDPLVSIVEVTL